MSIKWKNQKKIVGLVCSGMGLLLMSGCREQLASDAQKMTDQIKVEATRIAASKIDAFKTITLEQFKKMRVEVCSEKTDQESGKKPGEAAGDNAVPRAH